MRTLAQFIIDANLVRDVNSEEGWDMYLPPEDHKIVLDDQALENGVEILRAGSSFNESDVDTIRAVYNINGEQFDDFEGDAPRNWSLYKKVL